MCIRDRLYFHQHADATEGFQEIINEFMLHRSLLGKVEQSFVLYNLMNLANWRLQLDRPTFLEILSQLYDIGLKINVFIIDGVLSDTTFLNILANKAEVKEYEKVIDLMEKYQRFLLEKYREIALDFGQAYIHFYKNEYKAAMDILEEIKIPNLAYRCRKNTMLMVCYIEQHHLEGVKPINMEKSITNFQRFLNRQAKKTLQPDRIQRYKNFIKMVNTIKRKIWDFKIPLTEKERADLMEKLAKNKPIVGESWLLKKIGEL